MAGGRTKRVSIFKNLQSVSVRQFYHLTIFTNKHGGTRIMNLEKTPTQIHSYILTASIIHPTAKQAGIPCRGHELDNFISHNSHTHYPFPPSPLQCGRRTGNG